MKTNLIRKPFFSVTLALLVCSTLVFAETPVNVYTGEYDNVGGVSNYGHNASRYISKLTVNDVEITGLRTSDQGNIYFDKRSSIVAVEKGSTVNITSEGGRGICMHTFIYVDWNNDGDFNDGYTIAVPPATDIVSGEWVYTNYDAGDSFEGGCFQYLYAMSSSFVIPANQRCGRYNVRYKVDWLSNDPTGRLQEGSNTMAGNGGQIIDFQILIPCDSGLEEINADGVQLTVTEGAIACDKEIRIYDVLGHDVTHLNGTLKGVYLVHVGNSIQKVVVK